MSQRERSPSRRILAAFGEPEEFFGFTLADLKLLLPALFTGLIIGGNTPAAIQPAGWLLGGGLIIGSLVVIYAAPEYQTATAWLWEKVRYSLTPSRFVLDATDEQSPAVDELRPTVELSDSPEKSTAIPGRTVPRDTESLTEFERFHLKADAGERADGYVFGGLRVEPANMALCCLLAFWTGGDRHRMDRLFRESGLMREKWDEVHYADGQTYGEVTIERALQVTDERYEPSTASESDGPEAANSVATGESVGSDDNAALDGNSSRSRAHLLERNRLLRQRVQEQAARIEALEAAPEPQSTDRSADGSPEKFSATGDERAMPIRQRIQDWLPGGSSKE